MFVYVWITYPEMIYLSQGHTLNIALKLTTMSLFRSIRKTSVLCCYDPANIYLLKVKNRITKRRCELCPKLIIKIPEQHQWLCSVVFIVNFKHISHLFQVFLLLTLNEQMLAGYIIFIVFMMCCIYLVNPTMKTLVKRTYYS